MPADDAPSILIYTPVRRDAELLARMLERADFACRICSDVRDLSGCLGENALALLTSEEALRPAFADLVTRFVDEQPVWSDFPVIVFVGEEGVVRHAVEMERLVRHANVTLVDRPVRMKSLRSVVRAVARARQRQYAMRDLLEKLRERISERDRFLAILGHELRNPLGAIVLAAQMVDGDSKLEAEHARRIERQAQHVARLVDDLLDLSRITTGKITLVKTSVDLNQITDQSLRALQSDRFRRHLALRFDRAPEPLLVDGDPLRLEQVVTNLLTNAFKYTPEGGSITVSTSVEDGQAVLRVSDSGVGIAPDRIESIFELFSQAENAIGRSQGGMGIGLHLVRSLVTQHGGTVEASSDGMNHGSTFTVRLPPGALPGAAAREAGRAPNPAASADYGTRRIVVVDDNADIRDLLEIRLRRFGHIVETAADGRTGFHRITQTRPHAAIIDIGMPGLDGYELARLVRDELERDILLIALTGFGQAEDKEKALAAGFDAHLTKPIRVEDLQRILAQRFTAVGASPPE